MRTLTLLSGRRLKTDSKSRPSYPSDLCAFHVLTSKNVEDDNGDPSSVESHKYVPYDQVLVPEVKASDMSVHNILASGAIPQLVSPTGSLDMLQTSLLAQNFLGSIDESKLQVNEQSE